jgi:hypothetical protein
LSHSQRYLALLIALGWVFLAACESGSSKTSTVPGSPKNSADASSGALVLSSAMAGLPSNREYDFTVVALPSGGQQITTIQADVIVPSGYTRPVNSWVGAFMTMAFLNGLFATVAFMDVGTPNSNFVYTLTGCTSPGVCQNPPPSAVSGTWPMGIGQPMAWDSACTFGLSVNTLTKVFTFSVSGSGCNGGAPLTATVDASPASWPSFPVDVSAGNSRGGALQVQLHGGPTGGGTGTITASYDNVWIGYNNGAASPFDDFISGTINPARWATH